MTNEPTSEEFDPFLALYSAQPPASKPNVKVYDNVAVFEANMRRKGKNENQEEKKQSSRKEKSFSQRKKIATEVQNRDVSKLKELMEIRKKMDEEKSGVKLEEKVGTSKKRKPLSTVLTIMEKLSFGPLSLLHRISKDHLKCYVYTRHFDGMRGVLMGFIVAFDRYMNLAMADVDETFCMSPRGEVTHHQKKLSVSQLTKVLDEIQLKGVGDNSTSVKSTSADNVRGRLLHLPTTGAVSVKRKRSKTTLSEKVKKDVDENDQENTKSVVKRYDTRNPPVLNQHTFHGGNPQLYHRHINNLYVRGDSVVLISLPS